MGLLSDAMGKIGGLLGTEIQGVPIGNFLGIPMDERQMAIMLATGGNPEKLRQLEMDRMRQELLQRQMDAMDKQQGRQDYTTAVAQELEAQAAEAVSKLRAAIQSGDQVAAQKAREDLQQFQSPENQLLRRLAIAANGDMGMALEAGLVAPQQQEQLTAKMREYEFAKQNGYTGSFTDFMQLNSSTGRAPYYTVVPTTQGLGRFNSATGELTMLGDSPLVRPGDDPNTQGAIAGAKETGRRRAMSDAEALAVLPGLEQSAAILNENLAGLVNHPGKSYAVGASSLLPIAPGTPAAGFMSRLEQIQGEAFLQAFERLKGGGAITEIEGRKGEQAIARLSRAQSEEEFDQAVADLQDVVALGLDRARRRAAAAQGRQPMTPIPGSSPAQSPDNARLQELRKKYGL